MEIPLLTLTTGLGIIFFLKKTNLGHMITVGKEPFGSFLPGGDCRRVLVESLGRTDGRSKAPLKHYSHFHHFHQKHIVLVGS